MKQLTMEKTSAEENINVDTTSMETLIKFNININNEDTPDISVINKFETLGEECFKKFSLNAEQETAFKLFTDLKNINHRIVYCCGEGGAGKSPIINVIANFFDINNMIKRLFIGAFTGTAAFNIRGSTLHKLLSMKRQR
jgi:putative ribosome biogenesis GTPase RsgA